MKNKKTIYPVAIIIILVSGLLAWQAVAKQNNHDQVLSQHGISKVTVYKSPTCGCCVEHSKYLDKQGFEVEVVKESNMPAIKSKYNIPREMESCHTAIFGDYFVEGHVPIEAIDKLLTEKPDIDGIALPDMPAGSPGMPGVKTEPFIIYALSNGGISEFMTL
ncbi:hypothetical protein KKF61_04690 [Patescibacteria group bacterium]|nr:hypothetical protein [Patescibacteria group bacterium]MBU0964174.1 hypothetical protein [Patescibacteria group bacterium]